MKKYKIILGALGIALVLTTPQIVSASEKTAEDYSSTASAVQVNETVPLPAPIIEAFPDEEIADWVRNATHKDTVNDIITQADLDAVTELGMQGEALTGEQLALFNNEVFPNVTFFSVESGNVGAMPDLSSAFPALEQMEMPICQITSFPDANYPNLVELDLHQNDFSSGYPTLNGMEQLQGVSLANCNITDLPLDAWPNLVHIGEMDLTGNHIISVPTQFTYSEDSGYPVVALDETYTYAPITIQQGDSVSIYNPIGAQYEAVEGGIMSNVNIDGAVHGWAPVDPSTYYVALPTEELTPGTHELIYQVMDRYSHYVSGNYTIEITVE
ncbi:internalin N-terminal domain-containing protein [Listeria costaricensis]|uniref:internalin N-terminal domain-containing protein n=1 Tax=Listeria costaricensis TaxID=2026604 RepID=UPI000C074990|nr:leucine-rich repeat domain-containing protein [Listeria costaricensis]